MPISIGRKLQAFRVSAFPGLDFEVHRVALTSDQVREHGLPSTPIKETEKRADRWTRLMGVEQTEIDALASLQPDLLRTIALDAIAPFFDTSLARRVSEARRAWLEEAQAALDRSMDPEHLRRISENARARLAELEEEITAINDALHIEIDDVELPDLIVPTHTLNGGGGLPLISSDWDFVEQCRVLRESKAYGGSGH